MKIQELANILDAPIIIEYNPLLRIWQCSFKQGAIKRDVVLEYTWGAGKTPDSSLLNYIKHISGKMLVIDGHKRKEANVPKDLTW